MFLGAGPIPSLVVTLMICVNPLNNTAVLYTGKNAAVLYTGKKPQKTAVLHTGNYF